MPRSSVPHRLLLHDFLFHTLAIPPDVERVAYFSRRDCEEADAHGEQDGHYWDVVEPELEAEGGLFAVVDSLEVRASVNPFSLEISQLR